MSGAEGLPLRSADVWFRVAEKTRLALASGALQPIETTGTVIEDGGIRFVVREVSSLLRKISDQAKADPSRNPFSPYEQPLYVGDLPEGHVVLLNKFPVMADHLLVVTREFVPQDTLIGLDDFVSLACAMGDRPCLAFYNAGRAAGASQPHRHLQLVPLPFEGSDAETPIEPVLARVRRRTGLRVAELGYNHALTWFDAPRFDDPHHAGAQMHAAYRTLLTEVGIEGRPSPQGEWQSAPYNLLATREWMLLVPRTRERYEGISVNALGFAGSLYVKDERQRDVVRRAGPRTVLAAVT
jgi:sulfate adenylyltransferase (ADP) / ATP adenylyltransferase